MQRYRSGHNGADSKSVCGKPHEGSNPSLCAKTKAIQTGGFLFWLYGVPENACRFWGKLKGFEGREKTCRGHVFTATGEQTRGERGAERRMKPISLRRIPTLKRQNKKTGIPRLFLSSLRIEIGLQNYLRRECIDNLAALFAVEFGYVHIRIRLDGGKAFVNENDLEIGCLFDHFGKRF